MCIYSCVSVSVFVSVQLFAHVCVCVYVYAHMHAFAYECACARVRHFHPIKRAKRRRPVALATAGSLLVDPSVTGWTRRLQRPQGNMVQEVRSKPLVFRA